MLVDIFFFVEKLIGLACSVRLPVGYLIVGLFPHGEQVNHFQVKWSMHRVMLLSLQWCFPSTCASRRKGLHGLDNQSRRNRASLVVNKIFFCEKIFNFSFINYCKREAKCKKFRESLTHGLVFINHKNEKSEIKLNVYYVYLRQQKWQNFIRIATPELVRLPFHSSFSNTQF